jgi:uncharacterized membrane protein (UPF0127 family)
MIRFNALIALILVAFCSSTFAQKGNENLPKQKIVLVNDDNEKIVLHVEIARSSSEQTYGLMYRESLDDNAGMLFIFQNDGYRNFWMKNTKIPLSIAYISNKGVILEIYDMKPLDISITYPSKYPCKYAIEVNMGWFKKKNIHKGSFVLLEGLK